MRRAHEHYVLHTLHVTFLQSCTSKVRLPSGHHLPQCQDALVFLSMLHHPAPCLGPPPAAAVMSESGAARGHCGSCAVQAVFCMQEPSVFLYQCITMYVCSGYGLYYSLY